jgi:arylsulfatase A-like enzyme
LPALALQPQAVTSKTQPNILLLAADSLRPDFLGNQRAPNISRLKTAGTHWPHTFVHTPRTFPSWSEILSGNFSPRTGIRHMFPAPEERRFAQRSLVRSFKQAGYRTFVVGDYAGDIFPRFEAGFDEVVAPTFDFPTLLEEQILRTQPWLFGALAWRPMREVFPTLRNFADLADPAWLTADLASMLPNGPTSEPFFGVAFYSVAHFPYAVPWPYYRSETSGRYRGPYKYGKPPLVNEGELSPADVEQVNALFAGGVRAFDHEVGRIIDILRLRGLAENTILVILADHGENLYERPSDTGHGEHLIGLESLRIPFIVYDPTRQLEPGLRTALAQSIDILPTVMDLAGIPVPSGIDGFSLAATGGSGREVVFAESGIWFANTSQRILGGRRIPYPDILSLGNVDYARGNQIVLKSEARPLVLTAKHQMAFDGRTKVLYTPTLDGVRWETIDREQDPLESVLLPIPPPGAWSADLKRQKADAFALQEKLVEHARKSGATLTDAGWFIPGDGSWAP